MTYDELITDISFDKNIVISKKEYTPQLFGDFIIEFKYKKELLIQILSDRGISEISIIVPSYFTSCVIPLKYAVNYMQKVRHENETYIFYQVDDAYRYFRGSINILNEIIKNKTLRNISKQWKIDNT